MQVVRRKKREGERERWREEGRYGKKRRDRLRCR